MGDRSDTTIEPLPCAVGDIVNTPAIGLSEVYHTIGSI